MNIPAELSGRVCKTRLTGWPSNHKSLSKIVSEWPGSEIDVVFENLKPIIVIVFGSTEDCLAFTLKYGKEYV